MKRVLVQARIPSELQKELNKIRISKGKSWTDFTQACLEFFLDEYKAGRVE